MGSWTKQVNHAYNYAGGTSSIGTDLVTIIGKDATNNIASSFEYRGFGGVKCVNYGNGQRLVTG